MILKIDNETELHILQEKFAPELFKVIDANRQHLSSFLPWVSNMQTVENALEYIKQCETLQKENKEISFVIFYQNKLVGRIGIHYINFKNKCGAIGYWLSEDATGKGIITKACNIIIEYGFHILNLVRIELKTATKNYKSQAIAEKFNFTRECILPKAELVNGENLDLFLYAMLQKEWKNTN